MRKKIGTYEITSNDMKTFWAKSLPDITDLKQFKSLSDAEKYVRKKQR